MLVLVAHLHYKRCKHTLTHETSSWTPVYFSELAFQSLLLVLPGAAEHGTAIKNEQVSCSWAKVVSEAEFLSIQVIPGSWIANVNLRAHTSRFGISDLNFVPFWV